MSWNKKRRVMRVLPLTLLNPWNQKEGDESITSHPSETWNQKEGDESITSHPNETWNQHESWQTTNIWCMMKVLMEFAGFFALFYFFWYLWVSCPPGFLQGGGRACNKIEIWEMNFGDESITSSLFFFKHDITVTANKHHSKGSTPNCM